MISGDGLKDGIAIALVFVGIGIAVALVKHGFCLSQCGNTIYVDRAH